MTTYLDLLNLARNDMGSDSLSTLDIQSSAAEAIDGISACNKAWDAILNYSVDLQFSNEIADVTLPIDSNVPTLPTDVDIDLIKWVKNKNLSDTGYYNLMLISEERAIEMEGIAPAKGAPVYFYLHKNVMKVIPEADKEYTLKMSYQKEFGVLTGTAMITDVPFSRKWNRVFINGVYAFLKYKYRHGDADTAFATFYRSLKSTAKHLNKWNKKREGLMRYSTRSRGRPRRLF